MLRENRIYVCFEVVEVREVHVVCGSIHALQKAVAAVVQAVEHVREIVVVIGAQAVTGRGGEDALSLLEGNDQGRSSFLKAKALVGWVEDFAVAVADDFVGGLYSRFEGGVAGVVRGVLFDVDAIEFHRSGRELTASA